MIQPLIVSTGTQMTVGINVNFVDDPTLSTDTVTGGPLNPQFPTSAATNNWLGAFGMGHYVSIVTELTLNQTPEVLFQVNGWNLTAESGAFV
jgi:hypothetical protein